MPRDNKGKNRKHKPRVEQESHAMTPAEWEKVEKYARGEDLEELEREEQEYQE